MTPTTPLDLDAIRRRYLRITCLLCEGTGKVQAGEAIVIWACPACKGEKYTNQATAIADIDALINEVERLRAERSNVPIAPPANTSTPPATGSASVSYTNTRGLKGWI